MKDFQLEIFSLPKAASLVDVWPILPRTTAEIIWSLISTKFADTLLCIVT